MTGQALVLGGGGLAWMTGVLTGLADAGKDATRVNLVVGASAGSTMAAQLASGLSLEELHVRHADPALQNNEIDPGIDMQSYLDSLHSALGGSPSPLEFRRRLGKLALAADAVTEAQRQAVIASRLPSTQRPSFHLKIVAVDVETGEPRVFDNSSDVDLVDAVAASCAVPAIWPAVSIDGRHYVDGSIRSADNADYAAAMGTSPLDPSPRAPAARAGRARAWYSGRVATSPGDRHRVDAWIMVASRSPNSSTGTQVE